MQFLVDAMLGNLARWLRIFGHDAIFANEVESVGEGGATDAELAVFAMQEDRTLITRDKEFARRFPGAVFVPGTDLIENLRAIQDALGVKLEFNQDKARCTTCNAPLRKVANKQEVSNIVPEKTYLRYDDFWTCTNPTCGKVFWQGSHFDDIHAVARQLTGSD